MFYNRKKKYGGLGVSEMRRMKQLEQENRELKKLVADLSLDKQVLRDVSMPQQRGTLDVSRSRRTRRAICRRTSRTGLQRVAWSNTTNKSSAIRFRGASENAFVLTTPASLEVGASLSQPPL